MHEKHTFIRSFLFLLAKHNFEKLSLETKQFPGTKGINTEMVKAVKGQTPSFTVLRTQGHNNHPANLGTSC